MNRSAERTGRRTRRSLNPCVWTEELERRCLLAAYYDPADFFLPDSEQPGSPGIIQILFDDEADVVAFEYAPGSIARLTVNGTSYDYDLNQINGILLGMGGGNDTVVVAQDVSIPATINGDDGDDSLVGGAGDDWLLGGYGNDTLQGGTGNDDLSGSESGPGTHNGSVSVWGPPWPASSLDSMDGGPGNDTLRGSSQNDTMIGGSGNNEILEQSNFNYLDVLARDGDDVVTVELLDSGTVRVIANGLSYDFPVDLVYIITVKTGTGNDLVQVDPEVPRPVWLFGEAGSDTLIGGSLSDTIVGGSGADSIDGGAGDDLTYGDQGDASLLSNPTNDGIGDGSDTVVGGFGNDTLLGEDGADSLDGGDDDDSIAGGVGNDTVTGGAGYDTMDGGLGNDSLAGGDGNDSMVGGDGDDTLGDGMGDDTLDGGAGGDEYGMTPGSDDVVRDTAGANTLNFSRAARAITIDLRSDVGRRQQVDSARNTVALRGVFQHVIGSQFADDLLGNALANRIDGGGGDDTLDGGGGDRVLVGRGGGLADRRSGTGCDADSIIGGDGNDWLDGGRGRDQIDGGNGDDVLVGDAAVDAISGGPGSNRTIAVAKHSANCPAIGAALSPSNVSYDVVTGTLRVLGDAAGPSDDTIVITATADDFVEVTVNGALHSSNPGSSDFDSNLSEAAVSLVLAIEVRGADGNDTIELGPGFGAAAGQITLDGGAGNDRITGSGEPELLIGGVGNDTLAGGAGDDTLVGGSGNDQLDGSDGSDTADFSAAPRGVKVNLVKRSATGGDGKDVLAAIENVIGSRFKDSLLGDALANLLLGGEGQDVIRGNAGDDMLFGGGGNDNLDGGLGNDGLAGDSGNDQLLGGFGQDLIDGGDGDDYLRGGDDSDMLRGGFGNDRLAGELGSDYLDDWLGDNRLFEEPRQASVVGTGTIGDPILGSDLDQHISDLLRSGRHLRRTDG